MLELVVRHGVGSVPRQTGVVNPDANRDVSRDVNSNTSAADSIIDPPFLDLAARDRVVVSGPDALTYLQSQIAQDIRQLQTGAAMWTLVLEPNGKVHSLARVTRADEETFVFDIDAGFGEGLAARLKRFKIRVAADIELVPAAGGGGQVPMADEDARIAAGWPKMGTEIISGETIPAVTGVTDVAVNFTKGCYPGQELVERMDSRGAEAPSSLRVLAIGSDVPASASPGDPVLDDSGTTIGTVTSVGSTHALASIKRGHDVGTPPSHV
jgi:tRNA-modifying protein YgfZ